MSLKKPNLRQRQGETWQQYQARCRAATAEYRDANCMAWLGIYTKDTPKRLRFARAFWGVDGLDIIAVTKED